MSERADPGVGRNNNKKPTERTGRRRWGVPHACVAAAALAAAVAGAEQTAAVKTEIFRGAAGVERAEGAQQAVRPPAVPQRVFALPAPTAAEIRQARPEQPSPRTREAERARPATEADAPADAQRVRMPASSVFAADAADVAVPRRHEVGFGREFGARGAAVPGSDGLDWRRQPDGGLALALTVESRGAKALRAQVELRGVRAGLEVRVFDPKAPDATVVAVPAHLLAPDAAGAASAWTPTVAGDALAVELYLPPGTRPRGLRVSIPRVSHLEVEPARAEDIGDARCTHRDAVCLADEISAAARSAVAKYLFTNQAGGTSMCSGTLLNDADLSSQVPYFLTAAHCIRSQELASTMEFYWFFERPECGSGEVSATRQTGGATVLARNAANREGTGLDQVLVRLDSDPPAGVALAGWLASPAAASGDAVGVHHPRGDLKKANSGTLGGFYRWQELGIFALPAPDEDGAHVRHEPTHLTEGGSSGSGLWRRIDGYDYLVGMLTGGSAWRCEGTTYYGRLDRFYPRISQWLGSTERVEDSEVWRVERVVLVDAATRAEVADLTDGGAEVDLDATATRSFDVVAEMRRPVGSVALALSGAQTAEHASDWAPHTLFGAAGGAGLGPGSYTVTVTSHPAAGLGGDALERLEVPFTVTGTGADGVAVAGLAAAVGSRPRVQTLADDATLTVYADEAVELRARTQGAAAGSVVFAVSGASSVVSTASDAPFGVPVTLTAGTYRIVATPYPEKDAGGTAGEALEVSGVVVATPASPVSAFTLVDAAGGLPDPDLGPLADGATVDLSATHGLASVRADLAEAATGVERVELELRGARERDRTETSAPYALFGASGGDYAVDGFPDGEYELSARAFVAGGPRGALPPAKVGFTVTGGGFATPVESLVLVNATGPAPDPDIRTIEDGATLDLSATGGWANIRVVLPAARADIRSVRLELRGASDAERVTSAAPFTLFGVAEGDYQAGLLRNGAHTLTATGYSEPGGGGFAYPPSTVAFTVTGSTSSPVTGVWLVDARGEAPDPDLRPIEDGAVVSLAQTGDVSVRVSARAQAESVRLELDGPVWWRWVDKPPFFLWGFDRTDRADAMPGELPNGEYTLTAQPYTGSDGGGTALTPLTVSFTVADSPWSPTRVTGFTLLDSPGGDGADVDLARIAHRDTLILPDGSSGKFNVRVDLSSAAGVYRVVTYFGPTPASTYVDRDAPFTAFTPSWTPPLAPGTYRITAKPFGSGKARMTRRTAEFTVTAVARFAVSPEQAVLEEGESRRLTVSVDGARFARPQELTLAVTGDMSTADYALAPTLALAAGATEAHTTFTLVDDDEAEGTERATVEVRHAGSVVARARFTSVPNDQSDDARLASLSATTATVAEGGVAAFEAVLSQAPSAPLAVAVAVSAEGVDVAGTAPASVTFPAGATTVAFRVATVDDAVASGDGTVRATLLAGDGYTLGAGIAATVAVLEDDVAAFAASASPPALREGAVSTVTLSIANGVTYAAAQEIALTVSGDVDASDYALPASVVLPAGASSVGAAFEALADAVVEPSEPATVTASLGGTEIGATTVTVVDATAAQFAVTANPAAVDEGGTSTLTVSIANGVTYTTAQEIALSVSGDVEASDYAPPASVVLPAGASSVDAAFEALTDAVVEGPEPATVTASLGGTEIGATTVTVVDATTAQFAVAADPAAVDEGGTSTLTVSIADGVTYAAAQEIALTVSGDVDASDYELPATLELAAGASSAFAEFAAAADDVDEEPETATVTASLDGAEIGAASVTVADQPPLPALRVEGVPQVGATLSAVFAEPVSGPDAGTARAAGGVGGVAAATSVPARGLETAYRWLRDGAEIPGATGPTHVLTAADVGAAVSVRAARGIRSEESAATVPVWGAPGNPAVGTDEATLLSTTMTLGSREHSAELRVDFAGFMDETWYRPVGSLDAAAFELDGTRYRLTTFAVTQGGVVAFATQPVLPSAAGLVGYWDGHRLADFVGETVDVNGWTTWGTRTPQPLEEYERYLYRSGRAYSGPSDGVRVAVSLRREVGVPTATVSATAATVSEGGAAEFAVSLDGPREALVTVSLETAVAGAALAGAAPSSATFAPGETRASLDLATVDDAVVSGDGTVTVALVAGDGYELGGSSTATVSVAEDDAAQFAVSASPAEVVEGASSTVTVAIGNGVTYATAREVSLAVTGDVSASDYALPATVALAAGASSSTAVFAALEDEVAAEAREEARIAATVDGAEVGAATVAIRPLRGDATLSSLSLTDVDIGAFDAQTTEYAATVANAVESTTVSASPSDASATVSIADAAGSTLGTRRTSALAEGTNDIAATVTAEDGATTRSYAVTVTRPPVWGARRAGRDIDLGDAAYATGLWSDGATLWAVRDWNGTALAAYDLATGARRESADLALSSAGWQWSDVHSDGATLWASSLWGEVQAYRLSDGARAADRDVGTAALSAAGSGEPSGLFSSAGTLWVVDQMDRAAYAFAASDGARLADADIDLGALLDGEAEAWPWGAWSDGEVLLTSNSNRAEVRAYRLSGAGAASRAPALDLDTGAAGNGDPRGLWSDGETLWVADGADGKAYAYAVPGLRAASATDVESRAAGVPSAAPGRAVAMPDPALRAAVAAALGKPPHSPVGANELAALESLEARAAGIADLSGLEHAVRLTALDLSGNPLADLRALASLPRLDELRLDGTGVDAWQVATLTGLRRLSLRGNGVDDVSGLAPLVRLEHLDIGGNRIADLWPLANLRRLAELRADGNAVADVAPLLGLASLEVLDLRGNPVDDTEALERLPRLPR